LEFYKYRISGRVQGVAFRYYTKIEAKSIGVKGYVKNLPNGDVEVVAEGDTDLLKKFEMFLNKGPPSSVVTSVKKSKIKQIPNLNSFEIIN